MIIIIDFKKLTKKDLITAIFSLIFILILGFSNPLYAMENNLINNNTIKHVTLFSELGYEAKEKTSLDNPVVDPNFNVMRNNDMNQFQALILVAGILIVAVIAPLVTWWYFSK